MCGVAGIIERAGRTPEERRLSAMLSCIAHRGPDDEGTYIHERVGLGHRRLSILDVSTRGHQPMANPSKDLWIVYNGEVYNFQELRAQLPQDPPYVSTSDTEVLLRAYQEWGVESLQRFNGMYAFAILDLRKQELILARDPFGIKPLYYAQDGDRFYFSSEIKSMLAGGLAPRFNRSAGTAWAMTGWNSDDDSMFEGVKRVPQGAYIRYSLVDDTVSVHKYYTPKPAWDRAESIGDREEDWVEAIKTELVRSVKDQLVSDVPVGTYCSGGIDSSLLTAIAAKYHPEILAFNVANPEVNELDEAPFASAVAKHLGVKLHTFSLTPKSFRDALVESISVSEDPLPFVNTVPLVLVSKLARELGVKVLLSGEGADELFGGYVGLFRRHAFHRVAQSTGPLEPLILRASDMLTRFTSRMGVAGVRGDGLGMNEVLCGRLREWILRKRGEELFSRYSNPLDRWLAATLYGQLQTYLLPLLNRADRAGMAASIEGRVPFLDVPLVELALATPPKYKVAVKGLKPIGKSVLKKVAAQFLPHDIVYRKKMGFSVPASYYLGPWPQSWIEDGFVVNEYRLNGADMNEWLGQLNEQTACWMISLEIWGQMFMRGRSIDEVSAEYLRAMAT